MPVSGAHYPDGQLKLEALGSSLFDHLLNLDAFFTQVNSSEIDLVMVLGGTIRFWWQINWVRDLFFPGGGPFAVGFVRHAIRLCASLKRKSDFGDLKRCLCGGY
jgi:hypothetical protein